MFDENDETWGSNEVFSYEDVNDGAGVMVNGSKIPVAVGANFRETIKNISLDAGFGKYRVFFNGIEIKQSQAPVEFGEGDVAEIRAYDNAG